MIRKLFQCFFIKLFLVIEYNEYYRKNEMKKSECIAYSSYYIVTYLIHVSHFIYFISIGTIERLYQLEK